MTDFYDHYSVQFYEDDGQVFRASVDIDAVADKRKVEALRTVERLRDAVRREAQAIQDELDTDGTVEEVDDA